MHRLHLLLLSLLFGAGTMAQTTPPLNSCGQQEAMQQFFKQHPEYKAIQQQAEAQLRIRNQQINAGLLKVQRPNSVVTLPVVVHIIHNNGAENITDAQVFQGIQHLNEAFANSGYYDPTDGVNTQVQFCMAQRDPANNPTNGITRDVSPYTVMGGPSYYSDDQNIKNINRWNPLCYINIWLVNSIPGSVVGYAYLPGAHGSNVDGIVEEAAYFGSGFANDVVITHEIGHFLGLYHTFEGNCTNNDCTNDGDRVCDTPPDQSTAGISCTSSANSCTTDVLSGFATDQNDLTQDYMDYGNFNCMKVFTQGQADRMNWFIQNVRKSLLACKSCMNPCPTPATANFNTPAGPYTAAGNYSFTNTSLNAASYEWWVNGVLKSASANFNYTFPLAGIYTVKLVAHSGNALCDDAEKLISLNVVCGVTAGFGKSAAIVPAGTNINFTNTSTGADSYEWQVNGITQSTTSNFTFTTAIGGKYIVGLIAKNTAGKCQQMYTDTVEYTCSVLASFTPSTTATLINTPVNFTSTSSGASSWQWLVNGVAAGTGSTFSYNFPAVSTYAVQLIAGNGVCSASANGLVYTTDKCGNAQYQFKKTYGAGLNSGCIDIAASPDGGSVLASRVVMVNGGFFDAAILKLDAGGNTQWMYRYTDNGNSMFRKIKNTADGGYIAVGNISGAGTSGGVRSFIVKTTASGAISWSRELTVQNNNFNEGLDIIQSADGSYYFTGSIISNGIGGSGNDVLVVKLTSAGSIVWSNSYDARGSEAGTGLAEENAHLIVCGNLSGQNNTGFLLQLNKSDGSTLWAKTFRTTDENFLDVQSLPDGYYVNAMRKFSNGFYTDQVFLKTDFNGKVIYSTYTRPFGAAVALDWASSVVKPNGNIVSEASPSFGGPYLDFTIHETSMVSGLIWAKRYNKPSSWINKLAIAGNTIWAGGNSLEASAPPVQTFVMKLDSAGNTGQCPSEKTGMDILPLQYIPGAADFKINTIKFDINTQHNATPTDVNTNRICQYVKCDSVATPLDTCQLCNSININGQDSVCSFTNPFVYSVKKTPGCPAVPTLYLTDSTYGSITKLNDSSFSIQFKKTGPVQLIATINNNCGTLTDTLHIHTFSSPGTINLGPDVQLCKFSTLKLNAGSGFASYEWNDGSVDSVLTVFTPGLYAVTAKDHCGNSYTDAINITLAPDIPFDLGPDLQKCNNDTLTITAPGSFPAYSWAINYNISTLQGSTVKLWPSKDTTYTVVGQLANGCTVVDTIRIKVNHSMPLQLGNDTSFCAGDSLVIKAPAGFSNYVWQDGSAAPVYTAAAAGLYYLQATAPNGCVSKDSLYVKNVYPTPLNFLDAATSICNGKTLQLQPVGSWSAYHWSNNSSSPYINITNTGTYWLQVTSADGCRGSDTIVVQQGKNCGIGIYFPNAFTPDGNGSNDTYKAIVYTVPDKFHLLIYNRFGEKVFETTDFKQGWNGVYKGLAQPAGGFAWYCAYQFTGAPAKMEKGSLVLVR